jgi:hypothetical protein
MMSIEPFGFIEILLIVWAVFAKMETVTIIMGCLTMFVAAASFFVGGFSLNPAVTFLSIFVLKSFLKKSNKKAVFWHPSLFYLAAFLLYAAMATAFFPIFFEKHIMTVWTAGGTGTQTLQLLHPGKGNITQTFYAFGAAFCFFGTYQSIRKIEKKSLCVALLLAVSSLHIIMSILDLVLFYAGFSTFLDFIRNGNYIILSQVSLGGFKRVCGTFTEASFYATYTLSLFASMLALYRAGIGKKTTLIVAIALFVLLLLSVSTTAFVGLALYFIWLAFISVIDVFRKEKIFDSSSSLLLVGFIISIIALGLLVVGDGITLIDKLVLQKAESASGIERAMWNRVAWESFLHSYGLGIGLGSTRASSFILVLLSNAGVLGASLYFMFAIKATKIPAKDACPPLTRAAIIACREGLVGYFIGAFLSSTVFDLGLWPYMLLGASAALSLQTIKKRYPPLLLKKKIA